MDREKPLKGLNILDAAVHPHEWEVLMRRRPDNEHPQLITPDELFGVLFNCRL